MSTGSAAAWIYSGHVAFAISRSKARSASARRDWRSGWPAASTAPPCSRTPTIPFLADFYNDRPGAALQAQLFYLLNRHRQLTGLRQADLFQHTMVCDYLFDSDKIFAYLNLDDNELFIYQRLYDLLVARHRRRPISCVYLQAPTDVLLERLHRTAGRSRAPRCRSPSDDYLRELNEAYQHFFFHYTATPLLVVETSQFDPERERRGARRSRAADHRRWASGRAYYVRRADSPIRVCSVEFFVLRPVLFC